MNHRRCSLSIAYLRLKIFHISFWWWTLEMTDVWNDRPRKSDFSRHRNKLESGDCRFEFQINELIEIVFNKWKVSLRHCAFLRRLSNVPAHVKPMTPLLAVFSIVFSLESKKDNFFSHFLILSRLLDRNTIWKCFHRRQQPSFSVISVDTRTHHSHLCLCASVFLPRQRTNEN